MTEKIQDVLGYVEGASGKDVMTDAFESSRTDRGEQADNGKLSKRQMMTDLIMFLDDRQNLDTSRKEVMTERLSPAALKGGSEASAPSRPQVQHTHCCGVNRPSEWTDRERGWQTVGISITVTERNHNIFTFSKNLSLEAKTRI